jgi:hypothetical protein
LENEANASPVQVQAPAPAAFDPRRRIRELLSIPERDRTDAEWDELNELEIQTAPGNRAGGNQPANAGYSGKPAGFHGKNRPKGKPGGPGRSPQARPGHTPNNNPNNKPRPA